MLKKLLVTAATAGALTAGALVAGAPAQASPPNNYPSSVVTVTNAVAKHTRVPRGHHPRIKVKVTSGISKPVRGQLRIKVGGVVKWVRYRGFPVKVKLSRHLSLGWHTVRVTFVPKTGSVFKRSKDTVAIKIVRHHRHRHHNR